MQSESPGLGLVSSDQLQGCVAAAAAAAATHVNYINAASCLCASIGTLLCSTDAPLHSGLNSSDAQVL